MAQTIDYAFLKLIQEIQSCCDNEQYFTALTTALILPDMCSKIEYSTKKVGERYTRWCNKWLHQYLPSISCLSTKYGTWGDIIYKIRCGILHSGKVDVCGKDYKFFDLQDFDFYIDNVPFYMHPLEISGEFTSGGRGHSNIMKIRIDIRYLINAIVNSALLFAEHTELNYKDISLLSIQR